MCWCVTNVASRSHLLVESCKLLRLFDMSSLSETEIKTRSTHEKGVNSAGN